MAAIFYDAMVIRGYVPHSLSLSLTHSLCPWHVFQNIGNKGYFDRKWLLKGNGIYCKKFLHLYKRVCPSVCLFVCSSIILVILVISENASIVCLSNLFFLKLFFNFGKSSASVSYKNVFNIKKSVLWTKTFCAAYFSANKLSIRVI